MSHSRTSVLGAAATALRKVSRTLLRADFELTIRDHQILRDMLTGPDTGHLKEAAWLGFRAGTARAGRLERTVCLGLDLLAQAQLQLEDAMAVPDGPARRQRLQRAIDFGARMQVEAELWQEPSLWHHADWTRWYERASKVCAMPAAAHRGPQAWNTQSASWEGWFTASCRATSAQYLAKSVAGELPGHARLLTRARAEEQRCCSAPPRAAQCIIRPTTSAMSQVVATLAASHPSSAPELFPTGLALPPARA